MGNVRAHPVSLATGRMGRKRWYCSKVTCAQHNLIPLCLPGPPAQPPPPVLLASITNMTQCVAYYGRCRVRTNWLNGPLSSPLLETTGDYV